MMVIPILYQWNLSLNQEGVTENFLVCCRHNCNLVVIWYTDQPQTVTSVNAVIANVQRITA
jgi:hypothetical protein